MAKIEIQSQKAIDNIKDLIRELQSLDTAVKNIGKSSKSSLSALESQLRKVVKATSDLKGKYDTLNTSLNSLKQKTLKMASANNKLAGSFNKVTTNSNRASSSFSNLSKASGQLLTAFGIFSGVQLFANILKNSYELIKTFDGIGFAMERITGNIYDMTSSQKFLTEITRDYGVELVTTTNRYIKFLAAAQQSGLSLGQTEDIFRSMTKAASVLGLKTDELRGVYLALEQMLSKGKITTEELRRQLGERLPGAMGIMASSMGITIAQLDKMMKKGEVMSAEVLPNFAKAVERAYGIENEKRIETLISAQNRLTNSWQNFIKTLTEGDSWIKRELMSTMEGWADIVNAITGSIETDDQRVLSSRVKWGRSIVDNHKKTVKNLLKQQIGYVDNSEQIEKDIAQTKLDIINALSLEEQKRLKKHLEELSFIQAENAKVEGEKSLKLSLKQIDGAKKQFEAEKIIYEKALAERDRIQSENDKLGILSLDKIPMKKFQDDVDAATSSYARAWERWDFLRKQIQQSDVTLPEDDDTKTKKKLRDISDLTNKIKIENLERAIKYNEEEIEAEKTLYGDKVILADSNAQMQMRIQDLVLEDKIKRIENGFAKEIKETAKGSERAKALENEKNQKIELARAEHKTKLLDIEFKTANEIDKIQKEELKRFDEQFKDKEQQLENQKNIELKILRETAKTKKELDEGTKEINKKYFELQKQQLIELVQTWIEYANSIGLATKGLEDLLAKLKSESFAPDLDKVEVQMEDWIQLIGQAINEIGNLADALFERRIEQINAEIEKEKELYETKIKLAGDDVKEKESLEQQRDAKLRILEKKKLREEQKQARVRKAAALVQIGVSTALAVMKNVEIYGFGLGSAFNILTIALGAIQAATVLAQPIPQYKDGLDSAKTDHIGMINDGGKQEFLERNGELFTSTQKNMLVPLKVGDTIYKDFDDMKKNSILMSAIGNGNQFSQSNYNALSMAITGSIDKGLKKVKFNNNIRLVDNRQNNNYQQSLSKWN